MPNFLRTLAVLLIGVLIGAGALTLLAPLSAPEKSASAPGGSAPDDFDPNDLEPTGAGPDMPVEVPVIAPEEVTEVPMPVAPEPEPVIITEPEDATYAVQRVFFGTNRGIEDDTDIGPVFGYERGDALRVGFRDITIPKDAHDVGEIELPKSLTVFSITLWEEKEDPDRHFTVLETAVLSPEELQAMASEVVRGAETYQGSAFVFIHGFNTTFRAAMFRAAQGVTIYAASTDLALLASKSIRKNYVRLGDVGPAGPAGPVVVPGVDTIDVSAVGAEILALNHNIYARNLGVLDDLARLMLTGQRPPTSRMPTLEAVTKDIGTYWRIPE